MITIDRDKCIGCGKCVSVCPFTVLNMSEGKANLTDKHCLECMHCSIVCPVDAIRFNGEEAREEVVNPLPENCADVVEQIIRQRRSYRNFSDNKVKRETIDHIMKTAKLVPSAKNTHPTNWIIIDEDEKRNELMSIIEEFIRENNVSPEIIEELEKDNNPVVGINSSLLIGYCKNDSLDPVHDTAIALTSIELMMQARKIGTCWGGYLMRYLNNIPKCREFIGLPDDCSVYGTLMFGYPKQANYDYIPKRFLNSETRYL